MSTSDKSLLCLHVHTVSSHCSTDNTFSITPSFHISDCVLHAFSLFSPRHVVSRSLYGVKHVFLPTKTSSPSKVLLEATSAQPPSPIGTFLSSGSLDNNNVVSLFTTPIEAPSGKRPRARFGIIKVSATSASLSHPPQVSLSSTTDTSPDITEEKPLDKTNHHHEIHRRYPCPRGHDRCGIRPAFR